MKMAGIERPGVKLGDQAVNMGQEIDTEWLLLILKAKEMGLSSDEVRSFLQDKGSEQPETGRVLMTGTAD